MDTVLSLVIFAMVLVHLEAGRNNTCEEIIVPMCKGQIRYTHTKLPNQFGHKTQTQVYWELERIWPAMDHPCSNNFRALACGMYLPKCTKSKPIQYPCKETCTSAKRNCKRTMKDMGLKWPKYFKCKSLQKKKSKLCIKPFKRIRRRGSKSQKQGPVQLKVTYCRKNKIDLCKGLSFSRYSLPNYFHQTSIKHIKKELEIYRPLIESECNPLVRFFLCGIYTPFCSSPYVYPMVVPCRDLCERIKADCWKTYQKLYPGMPWSAKFQCHRFWSKSASAGSSATPCAMGHPDDDSTLLNVNNIPG